MRKKINLLLSLISLLAVLSTAIGVTFVSYQLFQSQVRNDLKQSARLLVETEVFQKAYSTTSDQTQLAHLTSGDLRITWIDKDGTVLFDNDREASVLANHLDRPEIQKALTEGEGESSRLSDTMNMSTFYYALLLKNGTVVRVSTQARTIFSILMTALPVILSIIALILIFCVVIGHLFTKQLLNPIDEMANNLDDFNQVELYPELVPFADKIRSQHENILAAEKSRQDFTANVTHELKTPIAAISGYAELIENRIVEGDECVHIAHQIRQNSERLSSLITDIIQLSELDHKDSLRDFREIDLFSAAKDCVNNLQQVARKKNIALSLKGIPVGINADSSLVNELLENLIQNAIRYNKDKGTIIVTVSIEDSHPFVSVKDTGIGIPLEQQDRVFERFYRVDKSRSRATGGTGLGLAIVKHIADIHGAEIRMESTLDVGTDIKVVF